MTRLIFTFIFFLAASQVSAGTLSLKDSYQARGAPVKTQEAPGVSGIDAALQEIPPVPVDRGLSDAIDSEGYHEMIWGRHISTIQGLKYLYTDMAAGVDIYVDAFNPPDTPADWENQPQYHFWDNTFLRVHLPVPSQKEWRILREQLSGRYGPGYHLEGPKNVHRWETDDVVIVLRFDESPQRGYLEAESKKIASARQVNGVSNGDRIYAELNNLDRDVKVRAINNLAFVQDERAVDHLLPLLEDQDFIVRYNAAMALGEIRDARAVPSLIQALEDDDRLVRSFVADALALIGDSRAVEPLIKHIPDNDSAAEALRKITGFDLGNKQDVWQKWWQADQHNQKEVAL